MLTYRRRYNQRQPKLYNKVSICSISQTNPRKSFFQNVEILRVKIVCIKFDYRGNNELCLPEEICNTYAVLLVLKRVRREYTI